MDFPTPSGPTTATTNPVGRRTRLPSRSVSNGKRRQTTAGVQRASRGLPTQRIQFHRQVWSTASESVCERRTGLTEILLQKCTGGCGVAVEHAPQLFGVSRPQTPLPRPFEREVERLRGRRRDSASVRLIRIRQREADGLAVAADPPGVAGDVDLSVAAPGLVGLDHVVAAPRDVVVEALEKPAERAGSDDPVDGFQALAAHCDVEIRISPMARRPVVEDRVVHAGLFEYSTNPLDEVKTRVRNDRLLRRHGDRLGWAISTAARRRNSLFVRA